MIFISICLSVLRSSYLSINQSYLVPDLTQQMFDARNMMTACDPRHGRYLTGRSPGEVYNDFWGEYPRPPKRNCKKT